MGQGLKFIGPLMSDISDFENMELNKDGHYGTPFLQKDIPVTKVKQQDEILNLLKDEIIKDPITYTLIYVKCQSIYWHKYIMETFFIPCKGDSFQIEYVDKYGNSYAMKEDLTLLEP